MNNSFKGDSENFDRNWSTRPEAGYLHWTSGEPQNQIQLAFLNHWKTFSQILADREVTVGKCLEVGCGRGSLSGYFSQNGWDSTLFDLSKTVIDKAKSAFKENRLNASFLVGDCQDMPFEDNTFDCIFSIGLIEHFENVYKVLEEQYRCLRSGGIVFGYIVPEKIVTVQEEYNWFNSILSSEIESPGVQKASIYRSTYGIDYYKNVFEEIGFKNIEYSGIYSMPMISNSVEFPFTLLNSGSERILTEYLKIFLAKRIESGIKDPWLCSENEGHAILVWATK